MLGKNKPTVLWLSPWYNHFLIKLPSEININALFKLSELKILVQNYIKIKWNIFCELNFKFYLGKLSQTSAIQIIMMNIILIMNWIIHNRIMIPLQECIFKIYNIK